MMNKTRLGLKGIGLGLALLVSAAVTPQASASPLGSAIHLQDAASQPLVNVQSRRHGRVVRRNRNGAAVAGALVGAAIVGGAIIAQSEADRRERRRRAQYYYYGEPQYYYGQPRRYYRQPRQDYYYYQPQRSYRQPQYYYSDPRPRRSYRDSYVYDGGDGFAARPAR